MDKFKSYLKDSLSIFWFPLLMLGGVSYFLLHIHKNSNQDFGKEFGGALFGVILGFIANMIREGIKDLQQKTNDRDVYLKLLEEDAKRVNHSMWLYTRLINFSGAPPDIKNHLPAEFETRYWDQLSKDKSFLRFGTESPFKNIFSEMWEIEKVNNQIKQAKANDKQAYQMAVVMYQLMSKEESTKRLLSNFMSKDKVTKMEEAWLEQAKRVNNK